MIFNIAAGKSREKMPPLYTVADGTSDYAQSVDENGIVNWELALLSGTSATLTFSRVVDFIDVFLVAGGKPGSGHPAGAGGTGGRGGGTATKLSFAVTAGTPYTFTVGESNGNTTIFGEEAASGDGANGGTGAVLSTAASAKVGGDGVYAFGEATSLLYSGQQYGAGGGGGSYYSGNFGKHGANGGATGGGHGAGRSPYNVTEAASGAANTGGGGGGGGGDASYNKSYPAGSGGSGIIIIRNHR